MRLAKDAGPVKDNWVYSAMHGTLSAPEVTLMHPAEHVAFAEGTYCLALVTVTVPCHGNGCASSSQCKAGQATSSSQCEAGRGNWGAWEATKYGRTVQR